MDVPEEAPVQLGCVCHTHGAGAMTLQNAIPALDRISRHLEGVQDTREFLLGNTRGVISLCSKAIIAIHKGNLQDGQEILKEADALLAEYRKKAHGELRRYMITPEQEFVEASCLMAIARGKKIPTDKALRVMPESYVLGLLDCVGELKRMVLDRIRAGMAEEGDRIFEVMEEMYLHLYTFSMYDKVLRESRRKIDVDRILVEDARSAITEEARRAELIKALQKSG